MSTKALIKNNDKSVMLKYDGYINDGLGDFLLNNISTKENVDKLFNKNKHIYYGLFETSYLNDKYHGYHIDNDKLYRTSEYHLEEFELIMFNEKFGLTLFINEFNRKSPHKLSKWKLVTTYEKCYSDFDNYVCYRDYEYELIDSEWHINISGGRDRINKLKSIPEFKPYIPSNFKFWITQCKIPLKIFKERFNTYDLESKFFNS